MKAVAILVLACLVGCANLQQVIGGYQTAAAVSLRAAEDNNIAMWTFNACATPYSAALRNPRVIPAMRALCGQSPLLDQIPAEAAYPPPPRGQTP